MTTRPAPTASSKTNGGKVQQPARQELNVLQTTERGVRAMQEDAIAQAKRLNRYELPLDMEPVARAEAKSILNDTFDALMDISLMADDVRKVLIQRAAKNSKATNDALAVVESTLWRREGSRSKASGR